MTPHTRVLLVVGGAALVACLTIGVVVFQTTAADAVLQADQAAVRSVQTLADTLLTEVHQQRESLDEYMLSGDPRPLAAYRKAVVSEGAAADQIGHGVGALSRVDLSAVTTALARVDAENDGWRATVAEPAMAAVRLGSIEGIKAAVEKAILDEQVGQSGTGELLAEIDNVQTELGIRSDALNTFRVVATGFGVVIELLAAALSLWFVRRFGLTVARDGRRRAEASAERIQIIASLRTLRMQATPEATAAAIAEALTRVPGIDHVGVLECTADGLLALAVAGRPGFPLETGQSLPAIRARYLRGRSDGGPWAERWIPGPQPTAYETALTDAGIKSQAYAPIETNGELIGLIAIGTTDEEHAARLVDDLPAVGEFASVAESILVPALVARRDRSSEQRRIAAIIASGAFKPVFQPVVDLATGTTVGYEALTRFADGCAPDVTFAAALRCGMGIELETVTIAAALLEARRLPPTAWLSLNVSPRLLAMKGQLVPILASRTRPIVLEITEHEAIPSYAPMREAMLRLGPETRLAVDDAGAGVANFNHLVGLRPDFVKIDASLVRGVDADPSRRAVVVGLIHFAAEAGCQVIAEGIETEAERLTVVELGVTLGQGYLLARPAPAAAWSVEPTKPSVRAAHATALRTGVIRLDAARFIH